MKKSRIITATALLIIMSTLLCSCTLFLNKLNYDKTTNIFTDSKTGIAYTDAPSCYESVSLGEDYARWRSSGSTVIFYSIPGMESTMWLTEEGKTVFYSSAVTLPTLREMNPERILICVEETLTIAVAEITSSEDVSHIIDMWESLESVEYPATTPENTYRLKFTSEKYPGLYYNLIYIEYSDGSCYIYRRDDGRCIKVGTTIHDYVGDMVSE